MRRRWWGRANNGSGCRTCPSVKDQMCLIRFIFWTSIEREMIEEKNVGKITAWIKLKSHDIANIFKSPF